MKMRIVLKTLLIMTGCIILASCLRLEDTKGALAAITADPRVEGQWHATKWMDQKNPEDALITLTKTERDGHIGYIFKSTDPEQQEDIESLWAVDFDGVRFFLFEFPEEGTAVTFSKYEIKQDLIYVYGLNIKDAQEFLDKNYADRTDFAVTGDFIKEISVKTLDKNSKPILKDLAAHPELWENAVIIKKAE